MMMKADFAAEDPKEVSAKRLDVFSLVSNRNDGWALVAKDASSEPLGLVPFQFLEPPHGAMLADFN